MPPALPAPTSHGKILDLARRDPEAAKQAVADLSVEQLVGLVCETPLRRRKQIL